MTRIVPRVTQSHKRRNTTIVIFLWTRTTIARFERDARASGLVARGGATEAGRQRIEPVAILGPPADGQPEPTMRARPMDHGHRPDGGSSICPPFCIAPKNVSFC